MNALLKLLILIAATASLQVLPGRASDSESVALPSWEMLEFEEKAFWATANSRITLMRDEEKPELWLLEVNSSVVGNSETIAVLFQPETGRVQSRTRLSKGKGQRMKHYEYLEDAVVGERRNGNNDPGTPAAAWPVSSRKELALPPAAEEIVVTSPYLLLLLAQRLVADEENTSMEVLVHTDLNVYRVRLKSGNGMPLDTDHEHDGSRVSGTRETRAVAIQVSPEGTLTDDDDFSLLGLQGNILLFFDKDSFLPLQVTGKAPRIGDTSIKLKSVMTRQPPQ